MAFLPAALAVFSAIKGGGGQQGGPSFQLPQFGNPSDVLRRSPIYGAFMPTLTAGFGRGAPTPTLNTPSISEDAKMEKDKFSTKDYITQAFLGSLIQSAFGPKQPSPYTFSPPVFR